MTINVRDVYPDAERGGHFWGPCYYRPLIDAIGNAVLCVEEEEYQGDSWVLYQRDGEWGFLTFGWGSCSGCDALQGCESWDELQRLADGLESSVTWGDASTVAADIENANAAGRYYADNEAFKRFAAEALARMSS